LLNQYLLTEFREEQIAFTFEGKYTIDIQRKNNTKWKSFIILCKINKLEWIKHFLDIYIME